MSEVVVNGSNINIEVNNTETVAVTGDVVNLTINAGTGPAGPAGEGAERKILIGSAIITTSPNTDILDITPLKNTTEIDWSIRYTTSFGGSGIITIYPKTDNTFLDNHYPLFPTSNLENNQIGVGTSISPVITSSAFNQAGVKVVYFVIPSLNFESTLFFYLEFIPTT